MTAATNEARSYQATNNGLEIVYKLVRMAMAIYEAIQHCDSAQDKYQEGAN